ncbi:MAG: ABC transporter permease subunit [Deinococcus-Thermus bacterium]|jgi:phosphate transport system permease protein|nr:ABC transporter permease subunit [Deinococcota bacterium]
MNERQLPFTGRRRQRTTHWGVRAADVVSRAVITVGGIGTIVAVSLVAMFLLWVIWPLIDDPARVDQQAASSSDWAGRKPVHVALDEPKSIGWALFEDGRLELFAASTGQRLAQRQLVGEANATAWSIPTTGDDVMVGFDDGSVRVIRVRFVTEFLEADDVPKPVRAMNVGQTRPYEDGVIEKTPIGQFRLQTLRTTPIGDRQPLLSGPVGRLDHAADDKRLYVAALTDEGNDGPELVFASGRRGVNMRDQPIVEYDPPRPVDYAHRDGRGARFCRVNGLGDTLYVAWADGVVRRFRTSGSGGGVADAGPRLIEEVDLVADAAAQLTAFDFLIGRTTLIAGTSTGAVDGYFPAPIESDLAERLHTGPRGDGFGLAHVRHLAAGDGNAITTLAASSRSRAFITGNAAGELRAYFMTSGQRLGAARTPKGSPLVTASIAPEQDGVIGLSPRQLVLWDMEVGYPEATGPTLFAPVWYEGYAGPVFMWQSSSATDSFEPKLSMIPLIFGTLKATLYAMLFGAPLALLAAIFTSEFLHPRAKARIKPTIELMASLPSVVLGFLAALVFAPVIGKVVPSTVALLFTMPLAFLAGAYVWQLLPYRLTVRLREQRFWLILLAMPAGVLAALGADWVPGLNRVPLIGGFEGLGPLLEQALFGGDFKRWLGGLERDPAWGDAFGGLWLIMLPVCMVLVAVLMGLYVNPVLRSRTGHFTRGRAARLDLVKFLAAGMVAVGLAAGFAGILDGFGFDLRSPLPYIGSVVGSYNPRNALVIGLGMGFAVIPIIYTIAEDALSTVPEHLRSGSLGTGATPWQTAMRIVVPTAMSGLFSAVMIGLGRAVGETMIVLMAFGGVPIMDMNIFSGGRTLSLNIAIELPEAAKNSTHYRVLFLSGLVLFAMTFIVNTLAEFVRLRFRRRAYSL